MPSRSVRATAYHEAGHAVAAVLLRRGLKSVSIIEEAGTLGRIRHQPPVTAPPDLVAPTLRQESRIRDDIVVCLAGPIAEERFCGNLTAAIARGAEGDRRNALDWATVIVAEVEVETYLAWLDVRAGILVDRWWPQVEPIAGALLERRRLSGPDARRIIRESMNIRPS